jgi:alpha-tubulin suppressor-like RCC1 family protein
MDPFENLLDENIAEIALYYPIEYIDRMCQISKRFNRLICDNNNFWKAKFIRDFGILPSNVIFWKNAYKNYGKVIGFGDNKFGELGIGSTSALAKPTEIPNIRAKFVACGLTHTLLIDLNNHLWGSGNNGSGQLGLNHTKNINEPTQILWSFENTAKAVSCGIYHTVMIDMNDDVFVFGSNESGQIGLEYEESINVPIQLQWDHSEIKALSIACGEYYTVMIDMNNNIWVFGDNEYGQLGLDNHENVYIPTRIFDFKAKFIACGNGHTMIIDMNDNVWGCGLNIFSQLGLGDHEDRYSLTQISWDQDNKAKYIACDDSYTMLIDMNDNVWACGYNEYGQLGLGDTEDRATFVKLPNFKAKFIKCGDDHTILIDLNNNLWGFGSNKYGQLGLSGIDMVLKPVQITTSKVLTCGCGGNYTMIVLDVNSQFIISFDEAKRGLELGEFEGFEILPEYQSILHKLDNVIGTFYGKDGNIYFAEIQYDSAHNQIFSPV